MEFELLSEIMHVETFASGRGIRNLSLLSKQYGLGKWRKRKGVALIRLKDGSECLALSYTGMRLPALAERK